MNKEDELLIAAIKDKKQRCDERNILTWTNFLDPRQVALAEANFRFTKHLLWGGHPDAERRVMIFLPDYIDISEDETKPLDDDKDPLAVLRITLPKGSESLSHRDYLGSITATGVDRNVTGDIMVKPFGADIVILKSHTEFFLSNYDQVRHASGLSSEVLPCSSIESGAVMTKEKKDTVASLRLDNVLSAAFNISRGKAQDAIGFGVVFVNGLQCMKSNMEIKEGDKIVLRGRGKAVLKEIGKTTKKDRIFITIEQYI